MTPEKAIRTGSQKKFKVLMRRHVDMEEISGNENPLTLMCVRAGASAPCVCVPCQTANELPVKFNPDPALSDYDVTLETQSCGVRSCLTLIRGHMRKRSSISP